MTRPFKVNGLTDEQRIRMCEGKRRWADHLAAVAGALAALEYRQDTDALYTYRCPDCKGWHLTRRPQDGQKPITLKTEVFK